MVYEMDNNNTIALTHFSCTQGDHIAPGIIPLAIKDVFSIIQDVSALMNFVLLEYAM